MSHETATDIRVIKVDTAPMFDNAVEKGATGPVAAEAAKEAVPLPAEIETIDKEGTSSVGDLIHIMGGDARRKASQPKSESKFSLRSDTSSDFEKEKEEEDELSDISALSDASHSSVSTTDLLGADPLLLVLSQFFVSSKDKNKNITDAIYDLADAMKALAKK